MINTLLAKYKYLRGTMSIDQYLLVLMINQTFKIDMKHGLAYI